MIRFECDYAEGGHQKILDKLIETNMEQTPGYGTDHHCEKAAELIKKECGRDDIDVHFVVGGTQANVVVIDSILRPYQGALCVESGHIEGHETCAVEGCGHKVITVPSKDGKIKASQIAEVVDFHYAQGNKEHLNQPGIVYISHPTENGTTYTKDELIEISNMCHEKGLPLFVDGARLAYGIGAADSTITIADLAKYADAFYIGGTKCGALFGEAIVLVNDIFKKDFRYTIKHRCSMLAKGRLLGLQFQGLFEDGLYYKVGKEAVELAIQIKEAFKARGIPFLYECTANQQFPILPNDMMNKLGEKYAFSFWETVDADHTAVRFCTSWATTKENVDELCKDIAAL